MQLRRFERRSFIWTFPANNKKKFAGFAKCQLVGLFCFLVSLVSSFDYTILVRSLFCQLFGLKGNLRYEEYKSNTFIWLKMNTYSFLIRTEVFNEEIFNSHF